MRDPETRRGVPLRAGVSLVAVAATVAATFALAGPASATIATITVTAPSPAPAAGAQGQTEVETDNAAITTSDKVKITVTQAVPSSGTYATTAPFATPTIDASSTGVATGATFSTPKVDGTNWSSSATVTASTATTAIDAFVDVTSKLATQVTVTADDVAGNASSDSDNYTVTPASIAKITADPTSATVFSNTKADITYTATDQYGNTAAASTPVWITLREAAPSGTDATQASNPFTLDDVTNSSTGLTLDSNSTSGEFNYQSHAALDTDSNGQIEIKAQSTVPGTVTVTANPDNGSTAPNPNIGAVSTVTVKSSSGTTVGDNVTALTVTPTSAHLYKVSTENAGFKVTATGADGVPVSDATVSYKYTDTSGTTTTVTSGGTTDTKGQASISISESSLATGSRGGGTVTFWVNQTTGSQVTSGLDSGEPSASASYTIDTTTATTVSVSKVNGTAPTGTSVDALAGSDSLDVVVNATDGTDPVENAAVAVDVTISGTTTRYQATAKTDADGNATISVPLTSSQNADSDTLSVQPYISESAANGSGTSGTAITVTFAKAALSSVDAPTDVQVVPGGSVTFPVTVTDQFDQPFGVGDDVVYSITGGDGNNATDQTATIGSDGKAMITYKDTAGTAQVGDSDTITFSKVADQTSTLPGDVTVHFVTSVSPNKLTVTQQPEYTSGANSGNAVSTDKVDPSKTDNYEVKFQAQNTDNPGGQQNLPYTTITVSVNQGFIGTDADTDSTAGTSVQATTDANGVATVYVGSTKPGIQTVTASGGTADSVSADTITYNTLGAAAIALVGPTSNVAAGGTATFTATVTDKLGNGVSGQTVYFSATDPNVLPGSISPVTGITGLDGTTAVTITVPADTTSAGGTITATVPSSVIAAPDNAASAKYTVGAAVARVKVAGVKGTQVGAKERVVARVFDADGKFVSNATVAIKVSGANSFTGTATTGANGELGAVSYTAKHAGTDTITATIDGKKATTTVTIGTSASLHLFHPVAQANGTFLVSVQTIPAVKGARVNLFTVYHPGKADQKLLHAGNGTANANGRVVKATSPGYLAGGKFKHYKAGSTYVLVARIAGTSAQSNMSSVTAK